MCFKHNSCMYVNITQFKESLHCGLTFRYFLSLQSDPKLSCGKLLIDTKMGHLKNYNTNTELAFILCLCNIGFFFSNFCYSIFIYNYWNWLNSLVFFMKENITLSPTQSSLISLWSTFCWKIIKNGKFKNIYLLAFE